MEYDPRKLYVGGIPLETPEENIKEHFEQYGEVQRVDLIRHRHIDSSRGYTFVFFRDPSTVNTILELQEHTIHGTKVIVRRSPARKECRRIYVVGLPSNLTEDELRNHFQDHGTITDATIIHDRKTKKQCNFGFVSFDSEAAVDDILPRTFRDLKGKQVEVMLAREYQPKEERSVLSNFGDDVASTSYSGYDGHGGVNDWYGGTARTVSRNSNVANAGYESAMSASTSAGNAKAAYGYGSAAPTWGAGSLGPYSSAAAGYGYLGYRGAATTWGARGFGPSGWSTSAGGELHKDTGGC